MSSMLHSVFVIASFSAIYITNAALPGPVKDAITTIFRTTDRSSNNNCEWEHSEPVQDTTKFPFGEFASVNVQFYEDALSCGECYELRCVSKIDSWGNCNCIPNAKVTVMITDYGNNVHGYNTSFDLPYTVATHIMTGNCAIDGSKYNINYKQVCCDHLDDIAVYNYEGMTDHWLSYVITEVRGYGSITNVYIREYGRTDYYECQRNTNGLNKNWVCDPWTDDYDAYFAQAKAQGIYNESHRGLDPPYKLPIDMKLTDSSGATLETQDFITSFTVNQEFDFGKNFDAACGPNTVQPTTASPITATPTTAAPVTAAPVTASPVTAAPITAAPVTAIPTTASPVTASPITAMATTAAPITAAPVTAIPTTAAPVTAMPTTASPVTAAPVTAAPITAKPTEGKTYVPCGSKIPDACLESYWAGDLRKGCCKVVNNKCTVPDPPVASDDCYVNAAPAPTTTTTTKKGNHQNPLYPAGANATTANSTGTIKVNNQSVGNHVNGKLALMFTIICIICKIL